VEYLAVDTKKTVPHIKHSNSTDRKHHFCQRDHGSISHFFSSRLISKICTQNHEKSNKAHKNTGGQAIDLKFGTMLEFMVGLTNPNRFEGKFFEINRHVDGQNLDFFLKILSVCSTITIFQRLYWRRTALNSFKGCGLAIADYGLLNLKIFWVQLTILVTLF
jgi:hypothetical protein